MTHGTVGATQLLSLTLTRHVLMQPSLDLDKFLAGIPATEIASDKVEHTLRAPRPHEALALLALRREASRRERANMKVPPTSGTTQCDGNRIKRLGSDDTSE